MLSRADVVAKEEVEVEIDDFGFTGEGYVRLEDGWLSVPGALPKERVTVRVQPGQREGARRLFADVVEILEASPERRDPLCERDAICRGCHLRHLTVAAELSFKVRTVREVIERFAELKACEQPEIEVVTPQPVARGDAYRIRSHLTYQRRGEGFDLGLRTPVREPFIPMGDCPALTLPLRRLIQTITKSLQEASRLPLDEATVEAMETGADGIHTELGMTGVKVVSPTHGVGLIEAVMTATDDEGVWSEYLASTERSGWLTALADEVPDQVGVAISSGTFRHHIKAPRRIRIPIAKWGMEIGYEDWFHATLEPAEQAYEQMMQWLACDEEDRLLDIGCGTGTITLMTSEHAAHVVGLDVNPASIEAAELNAINHERTNLEFVVGGWEKALRELAMSDRSFSVATINPMREPLGHRPLAFLKPLGIERLVYLGPSPEAAAKDVGELREMGWQVTKLAATNLHPATYHTMLMVKMELRGE